MTSLLHGKPHFFKYCTAHAAKEIIKNRTVKWSSPIIFNDPFDIQTDFRFDFDVEELKEPLLKHIADLTFSNEEPTGDLNHQFFAAIMRGRKLRDRTSRGEFLDFMKPAGEEGEKAGQQLMAQIQAWWIQYRQKLRVYCVSEVNDDILMWAHYADCHAGVVIKHKCIIERDRAICAAVPISYENEIPIIANLEDYLKHITGQVELDYSNLFTKFSTTKSKHWSYEKEWRCIGGDSKNDGSLFEFVNILPEEIEAIYFGCKISKEDQFDISSLITGDFSHIKLFKAHKHPKRYELEFKIID